MASFILCMVLHPEIQKKAQEAIDATIGTDRLPEMSDEGTIPYVDAVIREVLRWKPILPLGEYTTFL